MRIAVPTADIPRDAVHAHVATAPFFTVVDLDTGVVKRVPNTRYQTGEREINPVGLIRDLGVDVLICAGVGSWAVNLLEAAGIKAYKAHGGTVKQAIEDFKQGKLRLLQDEISE